MRDAPSIMASHLEAQELMMPVSAAAIIRGSISFRSAGADPLAHHLFDEGDVDGVIGHHPLPELGASLGERKMIPPDEDAAEFRIVLRRTGIVKRPDSSIFRMISASLATDSRMPEYIMFSFSVSIAV